MNPYYMSFYFLKFTIQIQFEFIFEGVNFMKRLVVFNIAVKTSIKSNTCVLKLNLSSIRQIKINQKIILLQAVINNDENVILTSNGLTVKRYLEQFEKLWMENQGWVNECATKHIFNNVSPPRLLKCMKKGMALFFRLWFFHVLEHCCLYHNHFWSVIM